MFVATSGEDRSITLLPPWLVNRPEHLLLVYAHVTMRSAKRRSGHYYGGPLLIGTVVYIKTYIFNHLY